MNAKSATIPRPKISILPILIFAVIGLGIIFRLAQFFFDRALWHDEAALALNVVNKSFAGLMGPLDYNQAAPLGFLLLVKLLVSIFGQSHLILRAVPLTASILSYMVFYVFLKKITDQKTTLIALGLFFFSTVLMRYAVEFKPYGVDVLAALLVALAGMEAVKGRLDKRRAIRFGAVGAAVIWFSYPSLFIFLGIGLSLCLKFFVEKNKEELKYLSLSLGIWLVSFLLLYFLSLRDVQSNTFLTGYWQTAFMPLWSQPLSVPLWFLEHFLKMFENVADIRQPLLALFLFVAGCFTAYRQNKWMCLTLILPLLMTVLASGFQLYPFTGKFLLFYAPFLYFLIAAGVMFFVNKPSLIVKSLGVVFIASLFLYPLRYYSDDIKALRYKEELPQVLRFVQENIKKNDTLYVHFGAIPAFQFYADDYGLDEYRRINTAGAWIDWEDFKRELASLKGRGRVWIIFSYVRHNGYYSEEAFIVHYLESMGKKVQVKYAPGASAYLFDFGRD